MSCCRSQPSSARFLAAVLPALRRVKVTAKSRHVLDARQTPAPLFQSSPSRLSARCSRKTTVIAARTRALCILLIRMQRHECHQVGSSAPYSAAPYRTDLCSHRRVPQLQAPDCHNQSDIGTDEEPTRFRAFTHLWAHPRTLCTDSLFWQGYAESQCSRNEKHGQRAFSIKILIIKECCL